MRDMCPGPFAYLLFPGRLSNPDDGKLFGGEHVQPGHRQLPARVLLEQRQPGQPVVLPHCCRAGPLSSQAAFKTNLLVLCIIAGGWNSGGQNCEGGDGHMDRANGIPSGHHQQAR